MTGGSDRLWRRTEKRLEQRAHPKWESLSWLALRPLIDSLNDRVNALAPGLVPELRQAWLTASLAIRGREAETYDGLVDRSGETSFLLMGDTGEQDASQYVVGQVLEQVAGQDRPPFVLICSDVIYPSGDLNDYIHGFYLPYEHLLYPPGAADQDPPPGPQRIYGLPGNHDWYDGLTGFMHTFVGVDALDVAAYGWPRRSGDLTYDAKEGLGRLLWRRPSAPLDAPLHAGEQPVPLDELRQQRMRTPTPGTGQPGPYFAIRIDGLLVVCIDGGIGSHGNTKIDLAQGRWLLEVSALPGPKILLTGYPLLVNAEWKQTWIEGAREAADFPAHLPTVNAIVAEPGFGYVAAIGGDIHNFQHYQLNIGPDLDRPMTYLVAGGGGAYISATHTVLPAAHVKAARMIAGHTKAVRALDDPPAEAEIPVLAAAHVEGVKRANARRGGPPTADDVAAPQPWDDAARTQPKHRDLGPDPSSGQHPMIPDPAESLSHFTEQVLPKTWRLIRSIGCFGAGGLITELALQVWSGPTGDLFYPVLALVVAGVLARALVPRLAPLRRTGRRGHGRVRAYRAGFAVYAAVVGSGVVLLAHRLGPESAWRYLACWAVLSVTGGMLGFLQRRSGWWREPAEDGKADKALSSAVFGAVGLGVAAALLLAICGLHPASWWILAAGSLLVGAAVGGWFARQLGWWRAWSQWLALIVQLVAAGFVLNAVPGDLAARRPALVALGLVMLAALALVAIVLAAAVVVGAAWLTSFAPGAPGWRPGTGRSGHLTPALAAGFLLAGLVALSVPLTGPGPDAGFTARPALALATAWGFSLLVIGVFTVDWLRRWVPGGYRWIATPLIAVLTGVVLFGETHGNWLAEGLLSMAIGSLLGAVTISLGYLAFLGGHSLLRDWAAHRDLVDRPAPTGTSAELLTRRQAEQFLEMRRNGEGGEELAPLIMKRALFTFPSTDQPQGIIQQKVSEFFSTDQPPFFQHFLRVTVHKAGADGTPGRLDITPQVVTGYDPLPADVRATISIPLPAHSARIP